jgi:hypothetical protein
MPANAKHLLPVKPLPHPRNRCVVSCKRRLAIRTALLLVLGCISLRADSLRANLTGYHSQPGLTAAVDQDVLTVTWQGTANAELRVRYIIDQARPFVRELAVRATGGPWTVLAENLVPDFAVQTGRRRIDFAGLAPLKALGVDTASREVIERQGWVSFWDAPFVLPGDPKRNVDIPAPPTRFNAAARSSTSARATSKPMAPASR